MQLKDLCLALINCESEDEVMRSSKKKNIGTMKKVGIFSEETKIIILL